MVDQLPQVNTCRLCGAAITEGQNNSDNICQPCAANHTTGENKEWQPNEGQAPYAGFYGPESAVAMLPPKLDPDKPRWGPGVGISTWLFSVAAIIIVPLVAVIVYYLVERQRGAGVPDPADSKAMLEWLQTPNPVLVMVLSNVFAHIITIAFCWAVVTKMKRQPFLQSLGWHWGGKPIFYWVGISFTIVLGLVVVSYGLSKMVPQKETSFEQLLKTSQQVKLAVAFMATFSAPFVEEIVYRGVLYSGLRKVMTTGATVAVVTLLFAGVHLPQYWGAPATLFTLTLLSFVITLIRAKTRSLLPCVAVHFINNGLMSLLIVFGVDSV
jgi:membrane protease YdiL (CAAX protease family)